MRPTPLHIFILWAILVASCAPRPSALPADRSSIALEDCVLRSPGVQLQVDAKCGSLTVPENPADPESRPIELNIAVVEAIKRSPEPDPLFILVGGPGQSAVETYPAMAPSVFRIHEGRDIVLVDQRGTGESNPLRCLNPEAETLEDEEVLPLLKDCPKTLNADPRFYTTDIAMQDLDRVRSLLGYETINLYGISYGTRAALVYLKMYPSRVRSLILDAVVDPSFILYQDAARDGQQALELFFERCEADEDCSAAYPELRSEFDAILQTLEESPVDLTIPHPITREPLEFTVTPTMFANIIFNTLYVPDLVAMLPLSIHQAYTEQDYAPLITQAFLLDAGIYEGMFYAVACTEDAPRLSEEEGSQSIFGGNVQNFVEVCEAWPKGNVPKVVHEPVTSEVPVLMFSGEADPITPPWHAEELRQSFPNSLHLVFSGMGHGNGNSDCARKIMDTFIEAGSTQDLDTACVESVNPPPFFVDFSGPRP